jgi:serine/threonine protein kinase
MSKKPFPGSEKDEVKYSPEYQELRYLNSQQLLAFLMGFHPRIGKNSLLRNTLSQNVRYDKNILRLILKFVGNQIEEFCLGKMLVDDDSSSNVKQKDLILTDRYYNNYYIENKKSILKIYRVVEFDYIERDIKMNFYAQHLSRRVQNLNKVFFDSEAGYSLCLENLTSLKTLIDNFDKESWFIRLSIALEVAIALNELHAYKFMFKNLRSQNVSFDKETKVVKLMDFSHACFENFQPKDFRDTFVGNKGDNSLLAPEQLLDGPISSAIDIYHFGNFLFELAAGSQPFPNENDFKISGLLKAGKTTEIPKEKCPLGVAELIQLCWSLDPVKRPIASGLIKRLKVMISLLSPEGAYTIDQEFTKLNSVLPSRCKLAFLMGLHHRVGKHSSVRTTLAQNESYEKNLLPIILEF